MPRARATADISWLAPQDTSTGASGLIDRGARLLAESIDARGVPISLREVREHPGQDLGVERGSRRVIEVDEVVHRISLVSAMCSMKPRRHMPFRCEPRRDLD